jgi:hypothetical protein
MSKRSRDLIDFFEDFRLAILRDLEWQAAARKARDVDPNSNSAEAENVPAQTGKRSKEQMGEQIT